jgi:CubicO group peptidase (beta-lactamase class C family)
MLTTLVIAATLQATSFATLAKNVDSHFAERESKGFSGVILLKQGGKTLLNKAYGMRDREPAEPMSTATAFDIGSIVKPLSRAAIFKLEAQGKLSTADTIDKYFRNVPADKKPITIDHLLAHTSGLEDIFGGDYELRSKNWVISAAFRSKLKTAPGEKSSYSNAGYTLLAAIIETVSGQPYETYMAREIFEPAGVRRLGYRRGAWKPADMAVGFRRTGQRWGTPLDHPWLPDGPSWNLRGNGGMIADANELDLAFRGLYQGNVLPPSAKAKFQPKPRTDGRPRGISAAGGNGIFNAVYLYLADYDVSLVGYSSSGAHQVEASAPFLLPEIMKAIGK